jgi:uncharacterized protein
MRDRDGGAHVLAYDPHTSELKREDGPGHWVDAVPPAAPKDWQAVTRVSPESPGRKTGAVKRLKIQLGLACNMGCSYCLQKDEVQHGTATGTIASKRFLAGLDRWLTGSPERIEFWGGEPLLYWHKIEILAPALRQRFPDAKFVVITNGTLLDDYKADCLWGWGFSIGVSHDGPGQHVRGPDPFDDPRNGEALMRAIRRFGEAGRGSINAVLSPASYDAAAVTRWFCERLAPDGGWDVPVAFEGVVHDYAVTEEGHSSAAFTPEQLAHLTRTLSIHLINGEVPGLADRVSRLIGSLLDRRPSSALGQKCGMDRPDQIAVDLLGNVTTCQNTGALGRHRIGHIGALDKVALNSAWHWSHREECSSCPVLQSCAGSCMYQDGDQWANSCNAEFAFNAAIFAAALFHLTGLVLTRIEGAMIRPKLALRAA